MARIGWSLTDGQLQKLREYCSRRGKEINEPPSFIFRRIFFALNTVLEINPPPDDVREALFFVREMQEAGIGVDEARDIVLTRKRQ